MEAARSRTAEEHNLLAFFRWDCSAPSGWERSAAPLQSLALGLFAGAVAAYFLVPFYL